MSYLRYTWQVLREGLRGFIEHKCFRHAAVLSFYTLFSIAPMIMVSIHGASLLASSIDFQEEMIAQFSELVGEQGAQGIVVLMDSLENEEASRFQLLLGTGVLLFSATTIFVQLQNAFNDIFSVATTGRKFLKLIWDRLISLGIILSLGLVMIVSLVLDSAIMLLQGYLTSLFPDVAVILISSLQYLVLLTLATAEIYALLHFLPDVYLPTRYKLRGCVIITALLVVGKSVISWYIGTSPFSELGGASASVIILMLWVYYSSLILFFGAELIYGMGIVDGINPHPKRYAVRLKSVEVKMPEPEPLRRQRTVGRGGKLQHSEVIGLP